MGKVLKRLFRFILVFAAGLIGFAALFFGAAFCLSRIPVAAEKTDDPRTVEIFIKTNGNHTDIVVPVRTAQMDWSRELPYSNNVSQDTLYRYVALGWGDKGFFIDMPTWDDLTFGLAFRAAFWMSTTAMHVTYYKDMPVNERCRRIMITEEQYARLITFIGSWFRTDADGHFIHIETDAVYGLTDAFYEARGRYNLFYSCNSWANDALRMCGQRCCAWTFYDKGIFLKYE